METKLQFNSFRTAEALLMLIVGDNLLGTNAPNRILTAFDKKIKDYSLFAQHF